MKTVRFGWQKKPDYNWFEKMVIFVDNAQETKISFLSVIIESKACLTEL